MYVVYDNKEHCLELHEKPLRLLKQLEMEGKNPTFMMRKKLNAASSGDSAVAAPVLPSVI